MKKKKTMTLWVGSLIVMAVTLVMTLPFNRVGASGTQAYVWKNVVTGGGGGYVPGIICNTAEKDLIYARTDIGGAYRWEAGTGSWKQLLAWVGYDDWNWTGCESIATDPVEPNRLYLAVGTYTNDWASTNGAILRSTDKGETFERTDLPFKMGSNMPGRNMGERLVIDPNQNSLLYLGTRSGNGLWRSTDYGKTWAQVTGFPNPGTYVQDANTAYLADEPGVVWITFDPSTGSSGKATQTIYVGVADTGECVYRSTDGGTTWEAVPGQPVGFLPHHGILGSNGLLYVTYSNTQGPYDGDKGDVYKYNTATGDWTQISPVPSSSSDDYYGYGGLAVDAQNPNTIMVATLNSWWPDALIFRSTDAGATWSRIWEWAGYPSRTLHYTLDITNAPWLNFGNTSPVEPEPAVKLGWMIGDLEIDPFNSDRMFYGTGATVYGTTNLTDWDQGGSVKIASLALGIEETSVQDLISPPSGANLYSVLGDISGFRHDDLTTAPAEMYSIPYAGTYHSIDYAELKPSFMVRVGVGDSEAGIKSSAFSYDGGSNWFAGNSDIAGLTGGGTVAAAADASVVVWAPANANVSYSKDNGNSWTQCAGVPMGAKVRSDRVNPQKFYAFNSGAFYISIDGGATFASTGVAGLPSSGTGQFKAVPGCEGDIWLCGNDGLYHSIDSGASFTKLANVTAADTIGFGKAASGRTYMALYTCAKIDGVRGIFRSDDAGVSWVRINDDQHQYGCTNTCITGDPRIYGRIYLGTNGFGIVYGDIAGAVTDPSPSPSLSVGSTATTTETSSPSSTPAVTVSPSPSGTVTPTIGNTPTVTVSASPSNVANCTVAYTQYDWGVGATVNIVIKNNGSTAVDGWILEWGFAGNQKITNSWCGDVVQNGNMVTVTNTAYNSSIPTGGSVSFGFNLTYSGINTQPTQFTLNGTAL
jgi:xyloglucan-specific exo-beta-1,4-glucanase